MGLICTDAKFSGLGDGQRQQTYKRQGTVTKFPHEAFNTVVSTSGPHGDTPMWTADLAQGRSQRDFCSEFKKKKNSVRKTQKTLRLKDLSAQSQPIKTFRLSSVVQDPKGREWAVWGDMSYSSDALWNSRGNVSWVKTVCSSSLFLCAKVDNISSKLVWPKVSQYL